MRLVRRWFRCPLRFAAKQAESPVPDPRDPSSAAESLRRFEAAARCNAGLLVTGAGRRLPCVVRSRTGHTDLVGAGTVPGAGLGLHGVTVAGEAGA